MNILKNSLGDRMKRYEAVNRQVLMPRTPAIIRIDQKAGSTWTKNIDKPFDDNYIAIMANVMKYLCDNIQGAVFGYCQSDEISILLRDYDTYTTEAWFGGSIQKIVSVSASLATAKFNELANNAYNKMPLALFDSRVFNIPKDEVVNVFIWRQKDSIRNSIRMMGTHVLGHNACHGINNEELRMKLLDAGHDWEGLPIHKKRGMAYNSISKTVDPLIPVFSEMREYVGIHLEKMEESGEEN